MKRAGILVLLLAAAGAALYYSEHHKQESRVGPEAVLNALADTQREIGRVPASVTRIPDEEEVRIGNALARNYEVQLGTGDAAMQDYVNKVGRIVAGHARRKFDYKFHYVPEAYMVNAFALPGGHVFIGKGLIQLMESEDELAGVLGHEIEHIDNYHCVERYQLKARTGALGDLLAIPVALFQAGYSKEQELEADRDGVWLAVMAGYSPQGAIHMFETFDRLYRKYMTPEKPASPDQELSQVAIAGLQGYFRSHPLPEERIHQVQQIIARNKWPNQAEKALRQRPAES
jgi:beta-barrel assembly-enhancing protease